MVECDTGNMGCSGGYLYRAWNYLEGTGIVTDACLPYASGTGIAPKCRSECVADSKDKWTKFKCIDNTKKSTTIAEI